MIAAGAPVAASVAFLKLPGFGGLGVAEQAAAKGRLEERVRLAIAAVPAADRLVLDAEDGLALVHFGDPTRALDLAQALRAGKGDEALQVGLNHGPLALTGRDASAVVFGDGLSAAAAAARFAPAEGLFVTEGFARALETSDPARAAELAPAGEYTDTRVRLHAFYTPEPARRRARRDQLAAYALSGILIILLLGILARDILERHFPPRPAVVVLEVKPRGEVTVDGVSHGTTPPLTELELRPGKHRIRISSGKQPPLEVQVNLEPAERMTITHTFGAPPPKATTPKSLWRDLKKGLGL